MHAAFGTHTDCTGDVIERRTSGEWQLALRRVRHEVIKIVRVATRVGDILQLRVEGRVEWEEVLMRLSQTREIFVW